MLSQNLKIQKLENKLLEMEQETNDTIHELEEKIKLNEESDLHEKEEINKFTRYNSQDINEYSLAHDVSIVDLKLQGFKTVYDFPYSHATKLKELYSIKSQCSNETLLCVGGAEGDNLLLVSCGHCQTVLTETPLNKTVLNNGAYWYLTPLYSFGFAPISKINHYYDQDTYDCDKDYTICPDKKRLSWIVYQEKGGWRLGDLNDKADSTSNLRKIMMLDSTAIKPKSNWQKFLT